MLLGLVHLNMGSMSRPGDIVAAARRAEEAGFDSVWAGEHVVLPDPQVPPSPMAPDEPALDSLLALTWAAAHTTTIRLATGILILPQRNPVVLAKEVATLDVLSGGRVMLGVGAGYLEPEFRAIGAELRSSAGPSSTSTSTRCSRSGTTSTPGTTDASRTSRGRRPSPPGPTTDPPRVAGHSPPAYRRAVVRAATGWYGYWLRPEDAAGSIAGLRAAAEQVERPGGARRARDQRDALAGG